MLFLKGIIGGSLKMTSEIKITFKHLSAPNHKLHIASDLKLLSSDSRNVPQIAVSESSIDI